MIQSPKEALDVTQTTKRVLGINCSPSPPPPTPRRSAVNYFNETKVVQDRTVRTRPSVRAAGVVTGGGFEADKGGHSAVAIAGSHPYGSTGSSSADKRDDDRDGPHVHGNRIAAHLRRTARPMSAELTATSDPDLDWAIGRMERWEASVLTASAAADDLITNWTEGRNIARFWPGRTLSAVMKERYPAIGLRRVQQVLTAAATRAALPDETAGMSEKAIVEAGTVTPMGRPSKVKQAALAPDPAKVEADQGGPDQGPRGSPGASRPRPLRSGRPRR